MCTVVGVLCVYCGMCFMFLVLITFVKERPRAEVIFLYTLLLPDDGQSNRPKHVVEI